MICGVGCGQKCGQAGGIREASVPPPGLMLAAMFIYGVPLLVLCLVVTLTAHWPPLVSFVTVCAALGSTLLFMRGMRSRLEMLPALSRIHLRRKSV